MRDLPTAKEHIRTIFTATSHTPSLHTSIVAVPDLNLERKPPKSWEEALGKSKNTFENWELLRERISGELLSRSNTQIENFIAIRTQLLSVQGELKKAFSRYGIPRLLGDSSMDARILLLNFMLDSSEDIDVFVLPKLLENAYRNRLFPCAWAGKYPNGKMLAFKLPGTK